MKHHEKALKIAKKLHEHMSKKHTEIEHHLKMAIKSHEKEGEHLMKSKKVVSKTKKKNK